MKKAVSFILAAIMLIMLPAGAFADSATPTGYYLRKYCDPNVSLATNNPTTSPHAWVVMRLGEFSWAVLMVMPRSRSSGALSMEL